MDWLNEAGNEGFACNQVNMREARTRLTSVWPAHGLLKMLGERWQTDKLSGTLQYEIVAASRAIVLLASTVLRRLKGTGCDALKHHTRKRKVLYHADAENLTEQLEALNLEWETAFKVMELAYFFMHPRPALQHIVDAPDQMCKAFCSAWRGLQAYQKHVAVKKVGDLTVHAYKDMQNNFGTDIWFDRECSPVAHAMQDDNGREGASEMNVEKPKKRYQTPTKAEARNRVGDWTINQFDVRLHVLARARIHAWPCWCEIRH
jgi:hypothetical protein